MGQPEAHVTVKIEALEGEEAASEFVRFHAVQSTVTFGSLIVISFFAGLIPFIGTLIQYLVPLVSFVLWILLMVKAYQGERFKLPIAGDVAEQHAQLRA